MDDPAGARAGAPYCYRHPDRETYISCQRCGRSICPDCMRQASVGFHCPECVAEGARSVRQPRTVAGGLVPNQVGRVSFILIGINVLAFLAQLATGGDFGTLTQIGALVNESGRARGPDGSFHVTGVVDGAWWRIATSAFLHFGILHLLMNMYVLYLFGPMLERMLGSARFVVTYALSLLGGALFVYLFAGPATFTVGASGASFGLFGCTLVLFLRHGHDVRTLLALLAVNAVLTLFVENISWQAHLGGLIAGAMSGLIYAYSPKRQNVVVQSIALGGIFLIIAVIFVIHTLQLKA